MPKLSEVPWFQIITAAIAAWGAGLSTFNYFAQRRRDRRIVKVEIHDPGDEGTFPPILQVNAVNTGYRSVHLEHVAIVLANGEEIVWDRTFATTTDDLPCELKEGKKFTANSMVNDLTILLMEKEHTKFANIRAHIVDEGGNVFRSRWHRYRMRLWEVGAGAKSV
jgi:hypothetical protein